jgi:hypothetical protein
LISYIIYNYGDGWVVQRWRDTPQYAPVSWVPYDHNWVGFDVKSTKFRDIVKELKALHPNKKFKLKFSRQNEVWSLYTINKKSDKNGNREN